MKDSQKFEKYYLNVSLTFIFLLIILLSGFNSMLIILFCLVVQEVEWDRGEDSFLCVEAHWGL